MGTNGKPAHESTDSTSLQVQQWTNIGIHWYSNIDIHLYYILVRLKKQSNAYTTSQNTFLYYQYWETRHKHSRSDVIARYQVIWQATRASRIQKCI